jgi:maltokinase
VAQADTYLPGARDGWDWCLELVRGVAAGDLRDGWTADFPARLGRLAADLHEALATPSDVLPEPRRAATGEDTASWHRAALGRVDAAVAVARELDGALGVLEPRADDLRAAVAPLAEAGATPVQRLHGDLHVGQVLRWPGGLAVVDFDGNPVVESDDAIACEPAARDLAQLLRSLDHVARVAIRRTEGVDVPAVLDWLGTARPQLLEAYRAELARLDAGDLLDERLVPAFEVEQECREIVYAARHLPRWAYAPLGGIEGMFPADGSPTEWRPGGR